MSALNTLGKKSGAITPPAEIASKPWKLSVIIWDVTAGELGADKEAETVEPERCETLGACLDRVADIIEEIHPDASSTGQRAAIVKRENSARVSLSKTSGNTMFRVRYVAGGRDYLLTATFEKA